MPLDVHDGRNHMSTHSAKDLTDERGLNLWCCGDQVRKRRYQHHPDRELLLK